MQDNSPTKQDTFLYNGPIDRVDDLEFIRMVAEKKSADATHCALVLVTPGGSPDAAFKIARYLQGKYDYLTVVVPGYCKSAGTLLAIGANELVFAPYGELGPLDIQLSKVDKIAGMESGLNISEAFKSLEHRARSTYQRVIADILSSSSGVVSFQTASHSATEAIGSMYGPIFARIDPEEVGSRSRAMRIGEDYGKRLNLLAQNLQEGALQTLSQSYASHGFVIDIIEAQALFHNVRAATEDEIEAIEAMGNMSRLPGNSAYFDKLDAWPQPKNDTGDTNETLHTEQAPTGSEVSPEGDAPNTAQAG